MTALTPLDVDNAAFRSVLRGYDRAEVERFRSAVIAAIEDYIDQIGMLRVRLHELEKELAQYRSSEDTLKGSLALAQRSADEHVSAARARADAIVEQARGEAESIRRSLADAAAQREQFEYAFHGLLTGFLTRLEQGRLQFKSLPPGLPGAQDYGAAAAVVNSMDTNRETDEPDAAPAKPDPTDVSIDMEDLTTQPASTVVPEGNGEETVVIPMAQPAQLSAVPRARIELPAEQLRRVDLDGEQFSAVLDDAGRRQS